MRFEYFEHLFFFCSRRTVSIEEEWHRSNFKCRRNFHVFLAPNFSSNGSFFIVGKIHVFIIKMVTPYMKAELTAAVTSLGYTEGPKYFKDQYCLGE